ncbi:MAG: hypothetical protein P1Q69_02245 [Candidatus Thorarchaeota archaeon]|nr:hypothetical protein [Candidatus Thorarchaeota archaeon]
MLKGMMVKVVTWGVIAGVALVIGTQILGSVSWVVVSLRLGNYIPFISIVFVTLLMQRFPVSIKSENRIIRTLLDVISWAAVVYLFFVLLVGFLPYGLLVSIVGAGSSLLACMIVRDPSEVKERLLLAADMAESLRCTGFKSGADRDAMMWSYMRRQQLEILQLPRGSFDNVVKVLRDRPMLPVALVHFEKSDFLVIKTSNDINWVRQVKRVLSDAGIIDILHTPPLLKKAILLLPLLDEHDGLKISDYVIASNEKSVEVLLKHRPERIMLFPNSDGLRIVARRESVPGIDTMNITSDLAERVVLGRDNKALTTIINRAGGESITN